MEISVYLKYEDHENKRKRYRKKGIGILSEE